MALAGSRPYLVRAIHEWLVDGGLTPHLLVDVSWPGAALPPLPAADGRLVFNVAPTAVRDLYLGNDEVAFSARFSGVAEYVRVPIGAVLGIYARENGEGLFFDPGEYTPSPPPADAAPTTSAAPAGATRRQRIGLKVVK